MSRVVTDNEEDSGRRVVPTPDSPRAWELVGAGRYMPRRTRGSFPGRELG